MNHAILISMVRMFFGCWTCVMCVTQTAAAQPSVADSVRVQVSRREMRVVFPRDTSRTWGWGAKTPYSFAPAYSWGVSVEGMNGPKSIALLFNRFSDSTARKFSSLQRLIETESAGLCTGGMATFCDPTHTRASVVDGRLVLVLRDSASVRQLFGLRPKYVEYFNRTPSDSLYRRSDSVLVEYVSPQIPEPDSTFRAEAAMARRRYHASVNRKRRAIHVGEANAFGPIWLTVGDTTSVLLAVWACQFDACSAGGGDAIPDSAWTVDDTLVAVLRPALPRVPRRIYLGWGSPTVQLHAVRPGTTTLRLRGLPIDSVEELSGRGSQRELSHAVVVTRPIARVELLPRRDTVRVGEPLAFHLRAVDVTGEVHEHPPSLLIIDGDDGSKRRAAGIEAVQIVYEKPGVRTLIGSLGTRADTLRLTVVPAVKP